MVTLLPEVVFCHSEVEPEVGGCSDVDENHGRGGNIVVVVVTSGGGVTGPEALTAQT